MLSLRQWFYKRAQLPLLLTLLSMTLSLVAYFSILYFQGARQQEESAKQIVQVASLAIVQHNRTLLESTLRLGFKTLHAEQVSLCHKGTALLTFPTNETSCSERSGSFGNREYSSQAVGMPDYQFYFSLPRFPDISVVALGLALGVFFGISALLLLLSMYRRIKTDLLGPLMHGICRNEQLAIRELDELRFLSISLSKSKEEEAVRLALLDQKEQILHDVRSPLIALDAAINMIREERASLPERPHRILRDVSSRIHSLVNDLLKESSGETPSVPKSELLSPLIDSIAAEKRVRYRSRPEVEIRTELVSPFDAVARVDRNDFVRVLSNIIDNAVEAIEGAGAVWLNASTEVDWVAIEIRDNGRGIPKDVLPRLMNKGESIGKRGGKGLGLYFAKTTLTSWGGTIRIESAEGEGTTVSIRLPKGPTPDWMISEIPLAPGSHIVILDDDPCIHELWKYRLSKCQGQIAELQIHHFLRAEELVSWVQLNPAASVLYLIDFELGSKEKNGLTFIQELQIAAKSILVTARSQEEELQRESREIGLSLLPKVLIPVVPIRNLDFLFPPDAVLIDDDMTIREMWSEAAEKAEKRLICFSRPREFFLLKNSIPKDAPFYIDVKLGEGVQGEVLAEQIYGLGFTNISLTTAFPRNRVPPRVHLREIRGKEPPWY